MGVVRSGLGSRLSARLAARAALVERTRAAERARRGIRIHINPSPPQPPAVVVRHPRAGWMR